MSMGCCRISLFSIILVVIASTFSPGVLDAEEGQFRIDIAPPVIRFDGATRWLTVRTDIPYRTVQKDMPVVLSLDGGENAISAQTASQDAKGNLVARFAIRDVKNFLNLKLDRENILVFECFSENGDALTGKQEVKVIQKDNPEEKSQIPSSKFQAPNLKQ